MFVGGATCTVSRSQKCRRLVQRSTERKKYRVLLEQRDSAETRAMHSVRQLPRKRHLRMAWRTSAQYPELGESVGRLPADTHAHAQHSTHGSSVSVASQCPRDPLTAVKRDIECRESHTARAAYSYLHGSIYRSQQHPM